MIEVKDGKIIAHLGDNYKPFFAPYSDILTSAVSSFSKEDIAAGAQLHLEQMMCDLLSHYLERDNAENANLMLAGGVFGNVKVTQKLKELERVGKVFVQPQMGDGGLCIGACALANEHFSKFKKRNSKRQTHQLTSMYLGPLAKFRNVSLKDQNKNNVTEFDLLTAARAFAESLFSGKVIGLINGRMEFGPRSLCNRSIIVKTSDKTINDWLNRRMNRTEFMPFAPVMRQEVAKYCIKNYSADDSTLNFMTSTIDCTDHFKEACPAVVHVDQTARPQIVTEQSNTFIWNVLKIWEELSGELSLVNTSFNVHEEPIICDVDEGLLALSNGVIDQLWLVDNCKATCFIKRDLL
jgi:carbamoyltransferase